MNTLKSTNILTFKLGSRRKRRAGFFWWLLLLILALAIFQPGFLPGTAGAAAAQGSPEDQIRSAWERLQDADAYQFTADVEQTTYPLATIDNIGREAETNDVHMEGTVRRFERTMEMILWSQGGSVLNRESGAEIRVEGDRAYARSGSGEWQEIENFTGAFAPGGDFSVFLSAVTGVQVSEPDQAEQAAGLTRYTFEIDGPRLAHYLQEEMKRQAAEDGSLPAGVQVSIPEAYRQMTGSGEAWLDAAGFLVRQRITLKFPPQESEWVEAELDVVYSGLDGLALSQEVAQPASFVSSFNRWYTRGGEKQIGYASAVFALSVLLCFAFWKWGRTRAFNGAVVTCVIVSTLFSPLLQSVKAAEYFQENQARAEENRAPSEMEETLADIEESRKSSRMPAQAALEAISNDTGLDADRDGLTDVQEILVGTDPNRFDSTGLGMSDLQAAEAITGFDRDLLASDPGTDSDGDGLTDYQENLLGTSSDPLDSNRDGKPDGIDSDFDGISDFDEVNGFLYNGKRWYTDPLKMDTNEDGLPDGAEWNIEGSPHNTWDLDEDGEPDAFDFDNDGDGVIDRLDLSPYAAPEKTFTKNNPFSLAISNLTPEKITYVELQFRPSNPDQLRYAYNVLDWPYDTEGQVKDLDNATFYDVDKSLPANPNANGDMKLIPMLEIGTGAVSNLPLTVEPPEVNLNLRAVDGSGATGSVTINQVGSDIIFQYSNLPPAEDMIHAVFEGSCEKQKPGTTAALDGSGKVVLPNTKMETLADGRHAVIVYPVDLGPGVMCADLPHLPREGNKWVDVELLNNYGISVISKGDGTKTVYVPVEITTLAQTQEKVAFHAKMLYRPETEGWGAAHSVRLVWMVQALVDHCSGTYLWECELLNNPEIIHSYYSDFLLTGVSLRENRGFETAVIYEDPGEDNDLHRDDALFLLSHVLERTFLAAYDCDTISNENGIDVCRGDGQPDFTIEELRRRFDHQANESVSEEERFELPDILSVRTFSYDHADQAMADMAAVRNREILADFTPYNSGPDGPIYPTLMVASLQRTRGLSLDAGLDPDSTDVAWNGNALALSVANAPENTTASLNWNPYRYSESGWQVMPMEDYWDELGIRYSSDFETETDEDLRAGSLLVVKMYYLALSQGVSRTIGINGLRLPASYYEYERPLIFKAAFFFGKIGTFMVDRLWMECGKNFSTLAPKLSLAYLGKLGEKVMYSIPGARLIEKIFFSEASAAAKCYAGAKILGALVLISAAIGYTIVYFIAKGHKSPAAQVLVTIGDIAIASATVALTLGKTLFSMLGPAISYAKTAGGILQKIEYFCASFYTTLNSYSTAIGCSMYANVISFIIQLGIVWGTFFYTWASGAIQVGTIAFGQMLALTIAHTIIAIFFFLMSLTVATMIIAGIISSIDAILTVLCDTFKVEGACFTITGTAAQIIAGFYFGYAPTVNLSRSSLGAVTDVDYDLFIPDEGFVDGNNVEFRATLHTTLKQDWVDDTEWLRIAYNASKMVTPEKLRQATIKYSLNSEPPKSVAGEMADRWTIKKYNVLEVSIHWAGTPVDEVLKFDIYQADGDYTTGWTTETLKAGINRKLTSDKLYISYAIPAGECWGPYKVSSCLERSIEGKIDQGFDLGLSLDVFPKTLDEFYALQWGDFPEQKDHDGDGLISAAHNGLDKDDRNWDQDGDGVPDGKEVELRQQGYSVRYDDPETGYDSDGDGLSDYEELLLGTDPDKADTDRDGLTDKEEVDGWLWAYSADGSLETIVTSEPTIADSDGDGTLDGLERSLYQYDPVTYPYHPRHVDPNLVTVAASIDDPDGFIGSYQTFNYNVVVGNTTPITAPLNMNGSMFVSEVNEPDPSLVTIASPTVEFGLIESNEAFTMTTPVYVQPKVDSGSVVGLASTATAHLFRKDAVAVTDWVDLEKKVWQPEEGAYPRYSTLAATTGWDSPYILAALQKPRYSNVYGEIVLARLLGNVEVEYITVESLPDVNYADTPPAVACNTITGFGNRCLVVWSRHADESSTNYDLYGHYINQNGVPFGNPFETAADQGCDELQPAVASDGQDFLVTWTCGGEVRARTVLSSPQSPFPADAVRLDDLTGDPDKMDANPSAVWTGDRYTVAWEKESSSYNHDIYAVQVDAGGSVIPGAAAIIAATTADERLPDVAYSPVSGGSLVVYNNNENIDAVYLEGSDPASASTLRIAGQGSDSAVYNPRAAYDPRQGGWIVAWTAKNMGEFISRWQAVSAEGTLFGSQSSVSFDPYSIVSADASLACSAVDCALLAHVPGSPDSRSHILQRNSLRTTYQPTMGDAVVSTSVVTFTVDFDYPDVSTIAGLPDSEFVQAGSYFVIGGEASDPTSGIEKVEVCLKEIRSPYNLYCTEEDNWQDAEGHETWTFGLDIPETQGRYNLEARAVDRAGNVEKFYSNVILAVDGTPPVITSDQESGPVLHLEQNEEGRFILPLSGTLADTFIDELRGEEFRNNPGMSLDAMVTPAGAGWQTVSVDGGVWDVTTPWSLDYILGAYGADGSPLTDPTGVYTVTLRARDRSGCETKPDDYLTFQVYVDHNPPVSTLQSPAPVQVSGDEGKIDLTTGAELITQTLTLTGTAAETGAARIGVAGQDVRLRPLDTAVWPGVWSASYRNSGDLTPSLTRVEDGAAGGGLDFDWGEEEPAPGIDPDGFNASWQRLTSFKVSGAYTFTLEKDSASVASVELDGAVVLAALAGETSAAKVVNAGAGLHDLVVRYTDQGGDDSRLRFDIALQEAAWSQATLAEAGEGVYATTWQYPLPDGIEGLYEIDLRGVDTFGNLFSGNTSRWMGEIDTAAPRLQFSMDYTGMGATARTTYRIWASDFNLSEEGWTSPCPLEFDDRYDYSSPWWDSMGGTMADQSRLYQIYSECSVSGHTESLPELQACDIYGHCAQGPGAAAYTKPNQRVLYLVEEGSEAPGGDLVRLDLSTGQTKVLVTDGVTNSTAISRMDGQLFYPDESNRLWSLDPIEGDGKVIHSGLQTGGDFVGGQPYVYWSDPDGLHRVDRDGNSHQQYGASGLQGLAYDHLTNRVFAAGGTSEQGQISIFDVYPKTWLVMNGADPDLYNTWSGGLIGLDTDARQIYIAGDCGDPAGGSPGTLRERIYGIHRLPYPNVQSGELNEVTGCMPVIRFDAEEYTILDLQVDTGSDKLYYLLRNLAAGKDTLWRANLDGSSPEPLYTGDGEIRSFAIDDGNSQPGSYITRYATNSNRWINVRLHAYDPDDFDRFIFTVLDEPVGGWLEGWPDGPTMASYYTTARYVPREEFEGTDTFTYRADDGRGGVITGTVQIEVTSAFIDSTILTPTQGTIIKLGEELTINTALRADQGIDRLIVYAEDLSKGSSISIDDHTFTEELTETLHAITWEPPAPVAYKLWTYLKDKGSSAEYGSNTVTVYVTHEMPEIDILTTVLTTTRLTSGLSSVILQGTATDSTGGHTVGVQLNGNGYGRAKVNGDLWTFELGVNTALSDPITYTVDAKVTDALNQSVITTTEVLLDLLAPASVTVTLAVDGEGIIHPGDTVRSLGPSLTMIWTESSDGSGVAGYYAGWTESQEPPADFAGLTWYTGPGSHHFPSAEDTHIYYAHLGIRDVYGNVRWQSYGPITVDTPQTPDLIGDEFLASNYSGWFGWMGSGASQIGADYTLHHIDPANNPVQRFYLTWDADNLAFAWEGLTRLNLDDVFIYLDTGKPGGTTKAFGLEVELPAQGGDQLEASYLIQVVDERTAYLMEWDGAGWKIIAVANAYDYPGFRLLWKDNPESTYEDTTIGIKLPFDLIGISTPENTPLDVVAYLSRSSSRELLAAMPDQNPLNGWYTLNPLARTAAWKPEEFSLTQQYHWDTLALGQEPNAGQFADSDLKVSISAEPAGLAVGFLESDLYEQLTPGVPLDGNQDGQLDMDLPLSAPLPVVDGQVITYTVRYQNLGEGTAEDVRLNLSYAGALEGGPDYLDLGSVAPGESGELTFTATVNSSLNDKSAELQAAISDAAHGEFEWYWVLHVQDPGAPTGVTIDYADQSFSTELRTGPHLAGGHAYDPTGVDMIQLEITYPTGGEETEDCPQADPKRNTWTCGWTAGDGLEGEVGLRARARDAAGLWSEWTETFTVTVEDTTARLSLDEDLLESFANETQTGPEVRFYGTSDNIDEVQVCSDATGYYCKSTIAASDDESGAWSVSFGGVYGTGETIYTYEIRGFKNGWPVTAPLTGTFRVDSEPPSVTFTCVDNEVDLADYWSGNPELTPEPLVTGMALDPSKPITMTGYVKDHTGKVITSTELTVDESGALSYTPRFDAAGYHTLLFDYADGLGNAYYGRGGCWVHVLPAQVDLSLEASASPDVLHNDSPATFTFTVTNGSNWDATGVRLSFANLHGLIGVPTDSQPEQVSCWASGVYSGGTTCDLGKIEAGAEMTVTVSALITMPRSSGEQQVAISVQANEWDSNGEDNHLSLPITFENTADLEIAHQGLPVAIFPGDTVTYTIHITNAGPSAGVEGDYIYLREQPYFGGFTIQSLSGEGWNCTTEYGYPFCSHPLVLGPLPEIEVVASAGQFALPGVYTTTSTVDAIFANDPNEQNNISIPEIEILALASLSLSKGVPPGTDYVDLGSVLTYTLSVLNWPSSGEATNIVVTDTLPAGLDFLEAEGDGWDCSESDETEGIVTCTRASLEGSDIPSVITLKALVTASDTELTNTASVSSDTPEFYENDNHASVTVEVRKAVDLEVVKEASAAEVIVGEPFTYTLRVTNNGPDSIPEGDTWNRVWLEDPLPYGVEWDDTDQDGWYCYVILDDMELDGRDVLNCYGAGLDVGETHVITLSVTAPYTVGVFTNTVTVSAPTTTDLKPGNNTHSVTVTALGWPDLALAKEAPDTAIAGGTLPYTLTVRNNGNAPAEQVVITDTLPVGLTFKSFAGEGWSCTESDGEVICSLADPLAEGAESQVVLTTEVDHTVSGEVTNTASTATAGDETELEDNDASAVVIVTPIADLEVTLSVESPAYLGGEAAATIRVTNNGPASVIPEVAVILDDSCSLMGASGLGWSCSGDPDLVCNSGETLGPGASSTITIILKPTSQDGFDLEAEVTGDLPDHVPANNSKEISVNVSDAVDLEIWKRAFTEYGDGLETDLPPLVIPGGAITYTLGVHNSGLIAATNLTLTDDLPEGLVFEKFLETGSWTCVRVGRTITCTLARLAASDYASSIEYAARATDITGKLANSAGVSSEIHELVEEDNYDEAAVEVSDKLVDLAVTQASVGTVVAGQPFTLTVTVSNSGPFGGFATLTALLPDGPIFEAASGDGWNCSLAPSGSELICTQNNLPAETSSELRLSFAGAPEGAYLLTVRVDGSNDSYDLDDSNNEDSQTIYVYRAADLSITKEVSPKTVEAGDPLTFSLTVRNSGPSPASGVHITDTLPDGMAFVSAESDMPGVDCSEASGVVTCDLNPAVTVLLADGTGELWDEYNSAWTMGNALDQLGVSYQYLDVSTSTPPVHQLAPYNLVIWVANDSLPLTADEEDVLKEYLDGGGRLFLTAQEYLVDGVTTFMREYLGVNSGVSDIEAHTVYGANDFAAFGPFEYWGWSWNADWIYPTSSAQIAFYSDSRDHEGEEGPVAVYTDQTMFFASHWHYLQYEDEQDATLEIMQAVLDHFFRPLEVGEEATVTIRAISPASAGDFTNTAHVEAYTPDVDWGNNEASVDFITVQNQRPDVDLSLTMTASKDRVLAGSGLVYDLVVRNDLGTATDVTLVDTLPAGVTFVSSSPGCSAPAAPSRDVICSLPDLKEGAEAKVTISVTVDEAAVGPLVNRAVISSGENDVAAGNNTASVSVAVIYQLVILDDDFEKGASSAWCSKKTSTTPAGSRGFLGEFNNETVCLEFENLPEHSRVDISFDLYIIRSWDGNQLDYPEEFRYQLGELPAGSLGEDHWMLEADGKVLLHTTFANWYSTGYRQSYPDWWPEGDYPPGTGSLETNTLGYYFYGTPLDSVYHLTFTFDHTSDLLRFDFSAFGLQDIHDESWGLDNVKVTLTSGSGQMPYRIYLPILMR